MKAGFEYACFAAVAVAAHLAAFAAVLPDGMAAAGGSSGADDVDAPAAMGAADTQLAALVQRWDDTAGGVMAGKDEIPAPPEPELADIPAQMPGPSPDMVADLPDLPAISTAADAEVLAARDLPQLFARPDIAPTQRPRPRPDARGAPAPAVSAPAQRAAGAGAQAQRGQGQAAQSSGSADTASLMAKWAGAIRAAIQRQQRPPGTNARGTVHLRLQINSDGRLVSASVVGSSGSDRLDTAALQAVRRARLPQAPAGISGNQLFDLPLSYR
ncbi:energy transducer TonB family protein [Roseinatronobacter sp. NSM]|uniref:energy transducer TonB family protein n=1 Tax=Roseinatronobacter sp. NSM TaxID=3457785 RepID=UPI0040354DC1